MLIDALASTIFFLLPTALGSIFTTKIYLSYLFGLIIYYVFFLAGFYMLRTLGLIDFFTIYIKIFIFYSFLIFLWVSIRRAVFKKITLNKQEFFLISILIILSAANFIFVWKGKTPYPLTLNWDTYEHITLANSIAQGKFSFLPSFISDTFTFDGYSTLFQTLLALPKILFNLDLVGIYWWIEYWFYLAVILTTFFVLKKITGKLEIAFFGGLLSLLIFQSSIVYIPLFLLPQTIAGLLAFIALSNLIFGHDRHMLIALVPVFLFHFIIGALAIVLFVLILFLKKQHIFINRSLIIFFCISLLSIVSNLLGLWTITYREEADYFALPLGQKLTMLFQWYNLTLPIMFPAGVYLILKSQTNSLKLLLVCCLVTLAISLAPLSYFLKFFVLAGFFVNLIISLGLAFLLNFLSKPLRFLTIAWTILIMFNVFIINQNKYKEYLYYEGNYSQISKAELEAGKWLSLNFPSETLLISDPGTQYILEAISGLNSQGGAYMDIDSREKLISLHYSKDSLKIHQTLYQINDLLSDKDKSSKRLFIVGGKYFAWQNLTEQQKKSFYFNIWRPHRIDYADIPYLNFLTSNFKVIYQNNELVILEI